VANCTRLDVVENKAISRFLLQPSLC